MSLEKKYSQIKCYSNNFSLSSPEVIKSLFNFYKHYLVYGKDNIETFNFITNVAVKPRAGKSLKKWIDRQKEDDFDSSIVVAEIRDLFFAHINSIERDILKKGKSTDDSSKLKHFSVELISKIKSDDFTFFLDKIRWSFEEWKDEQFDELLSEIIQSIEPLNYNKKIAPKIIVSYLLHQIIISSSAKNIEERRLSDDLLLTLLTDTIQDSNVYNSLDINFLLLLNQSFRTDEKIAGIKTDTQQILNLLQKNVDASFKKQELKKLFDNLKKWFSVLDYQLGNIEIIEDNFFYFEILLKERRRTTKVLIYGLTSEIGVNEINIIEALRNSYDCDESWIISTSHPSPSARQKTENNKNGQVLIYNFDELIEETIDFTNYFNWLDKEISDNNINNKYIPLGAKKGEYDPVTKEIVATNVYGEKEGWLNGYIDSWLEDKHKEHVSILGEFGTGKTWFTLYTAWCQVNRYREAKFKKLPRPRIPILIPLRDFSKALQVDVLISDFFFRKHQVEIKGAFGAFMLLNEMGKLFLIFDGFDEMAEKVDKQKMIDNFWELSSIIKEQSKVLMTCRNEHFASVMEKKSLFNSEFKQSTKQITGFYPHFELIELLKFNSEQIKKVLSFITDTATIELIFRNEKIIDLLSRPIMTDLIIDSIKEIEQGNEINLSTIYFYATRRKMERDISQGRTFTSMSDKLFFMSELAWEMLSNDKLTISFKEFPEIIRQYFRTKANESDLDFWRYDMRGQSMLIIDEEGNYKPAHKSLLEFFVAFKIGYELGLLKEEFLEDS